MDRARTKVKKLREERRFRDCKAAVDWVRAGVGGDQAEAKVAPQPGLAVKYTELDGNVVASVEVKFSLDTENSYTKIVEPTWANMSAEDKRAVKSYTDALQAHEDGHIKVAEDYLGQAGKTIETDGQTRREAKEKLIERVQEYVQDTQSGLDRETDQYDSTTDHGRNQAAVGGTNTRLDCP
jgi:predicted secreted Zn-dependent protease